MKRARPINLNLFAFRFPLPAIVSILHRVSGALLFLCIPVALWTLDYSLTPDGFEALHAWRANLFTKLVIWAILAAFLFHMVAGIRHLFADLHFGTTLAGGRLTAKAVFVVAAIFIILAGIWLW